MPWITQAEFARAMKVNRSTVNRWIGRGRIAVNAEGLIDPEAARVQLEATESPALHHQARIAQIAEQKAAPAAAPAADATGIGLRLKVAMAAEREAKAQLAALEVDRRAGALVERAEVDYLLDDFGATLRGLLEGMADRLTPMLAARAGDTAGIHKALSDAAHELSTEMSEHMARRVTALQPEGRE